MRHESEPALIFEIFFSCLLRLSEVKYHWSKSGKEMINQEVLVVFPTAYRRAEYYVCDCRRQRNNTEAFARSPGGGRKGLR